MHNLTLKLLLHPLTKAYSWQLAAVGPEVRWSGIDVLRMMQMLTQHTDKVHLIIIEVPTVNAYIPGAKRMLSCISYHVFEWL